MDGYIDLRICSDPEFTVNFLLSTLFSKLHRGLARHKNGDIGISFPELDKNKPTLGHVLRLHGSHETLAEFMATEWLHGMRDHLSVSDVSDVPSSASYRVVRRVQVKSNVDRLRRRQIKRHGLTEEQARERIPDDASQRSSLPFVCIKSSSTKREFRLFIQHNDLSPIAKSGRFNSYGLSSSATIPWF